MKTRVDSQSPNRRHQTKGFTLIEVLVVVAIIALLIAILLPSLAAAREQAKYITCQSNIRQIAGAFIMYSTDYDGRLPGIQDDQADWHGRNNVLPSKFPDPPHYRYPEGGTLYKYMGEQTEAYWCPSTPNYKTGSWHTNVNYQALAMLSGAKTEWLVGGHYVKKINDHPGYDRKDHRNNMNTFNTAPMIFEHFEGESTHNEGGFAFVNNSVHQHSVANRHKTTDSVPGSSIAYVDGHAGTFSERGPGVVKTFDDQVDKDLHFTARSLCVLRNGNTFINGRAYENFYKDGPYGMMDRASPADSAKHVGPDPDNN